MNRRRDLSLAIATLALAAAAPLASGAAEKLDARVDLALNADRQEWVARVEGGVRAYQVFAEQAYATFQRQTRERRAELSSPASQGSYLSGPTLRRHDVFVTATGFHVFKGSTHFPYLESDFVHLSEAEGKALFLSSATRP
jgi:hypothetical protein